MEAELSASPAAPGFGAGNGWRWLILPGGMQGVLALGWAAAAIPAEDWHPGQWDQPRFAWSPTSMEHPEGTGRAAGPAIHTVDNPQETSPNLGFNYSWAERCGSTGEGSVQASSFPSTFI